MIRKVSISDAADICSIYNEYIIKTQITFEEVALSAEEMASRVSAITQNYPWLVDEEDGRIVGYAYASKWKERSAYRNTVEAGIYLAPNFIGKGIGTKLTEALIRDLRAQSIHSVLCGIALPNPESIALCEKFGFQEVGQFKEVGFKFNRWIDVGYWELIL